MRGVAWGVAALLVALPCAAAAQVPGCAKTDFEAVVNGAGAALRDLNRQNTPRFQNKLRELKDKRGWDNDRFLKEAEPFVRDSEMVAYDQKSEELLNRITGGGQQSTSVTAPDCAVLAGLRDAMQLLVQTQKAKWAHMFAKIEKELAK